jgi:preprotein translocase subunit SecF
MLTESIQNTPSDNDYEKEGIIDNGLNVEVIAEKLEQKLFDSIQSFNFGKVYNFKCRLESAKREYQAEIAAKIANYFHERLNWKYHKTQMKCAFIQKSAPSKLWPSVSVTKTDYGSYKKNTSENWRKSRFGNSTSKKN